jgi:hypothetical protein
MKDINTTETVSVNLYPLCPLIAKTLTILPGIDGLVALLVVANVAAISVLLLFRYVRQYYGDEGKTLPTHAFVYGLATPGRCSGAVLVAPERDRVLAGCNSFIAILVGCFAAIPE